MKSPGSRDKHGHNTDGSLGSREDHCRTTARIATRLGIRRRRRLPFSNQRRKDAHRHSSNRRRPRTLARDFASANRQMDCCRKKCSAGVLRSEAHISRTTAALSRSENRLPKRKSIVTATAPPLPPRALHDRTNVRQPTSSVRRTTPRRGSRYRFLTRRDRNPNPDSLSAIEKSTIEV